MLANVAGEGRNRKGGFVLSVKLRGGKVLILVSGATKTVNKFAGHPNLGQLITPHDGNKIRTDMPWAADNAAYSNWDRKKWLAMLNRIDGMNPLFVVAPDVVGDAMKTLKNVAIM